MNQDHYTVLGVSPTAEDVVIRAAYHALMRHYHPDRNASAEAAGRARAVNQAFAVIGDPQKRADYDALRADHTFDYLGIAAEEQRPAPRRQWSRLAGGLAAGLALILTVTLMPLGQSQQPRQVRDTPARAKPVAAPVAMIPSASEQAPVSQSAPTAVQSLPDDRAVEERPIATERKVEPPPPPKVATELAAASRPALPRPGPRTAAPGATPPSAQSRPAAAKPPSAATKPSPAADPTRFAALERHSALLYSQSLNHADPAKKSLLQGARDRFAATRSGCRSDSCVTQAYLGHISEVGRIMEARGRPQPETSPRSP